jgi:predicted phage terminase large subunit-like protein
LECREAFYGGAAAGGKSDALLMAALQYVDVPGYSAILFRRTYRDLALDGALMDRAADWLGGTDARWNSQDKRWTFPSGATLTFGYMDTESDKYRYKSAEWAFVGFDELTQFTETQYLFMFSRLRRLIGADVPLRMRSASNPGDVGHDWVKERFILFPKADRVFIPAKIDDNPSVDQESYVSNLNELDPVTRAQMLAGDWDAYEGGMFCRDWFKTVDEVPVKAERVRYWDKAGVPKKTACYTVGVLMAKSPEGIYYIEDVVRGQWAAHERNKVMLDIARMDDERYPRKVTIWIEEEPGSGGKESAEYSAKLLAGFNVKTERATGAKEDRARPFASQCGAGNVRLKLAPWNKAYIDELTLFPNGKLKDQVDASSAGFNRLALRRNLKVWVW